MTKYIVHLYREMRLTYTNIEADTPEGAAATAGSKTTDDADNVEDCEGQNLAALIDVAGDEDFSQSVTIDFEPERVRNAASKLLAACRMVVARWERGDLAEAARACDAAIAEAISAGIPSVSTTVAPELLEVLRLAQLALNTAPRFRVGDTDSYKIATTVDNAIAQASGKTPSGADRTLIIEVRGGVVQEVSNVPPGWDYEIIDYDNAE